MPLISYAAVSDIRAWGPGGIGIQTSEASDADVNMYLDIASRRVDDHCGQSFEPVTVPTTLTFPDVRQPILPLPEPFSQITQVVSNGMVFGSNASSTVQASPAPTTTAFAVVPGQGAKFFGVRSAIVGGQDCIIQSVSGDVVTLASPLATAPSPGAAVNQYSWTVDGAGLRLYIPGFFDVDGFPRRDFSPLDMSPRQGSPFGATILVTGIFGWAAVPSPVKAATILVTAYLLQNRGTSLYDLNVQQIQVEGFRQVMQRANADGEPSTTGVAEADRMLRRYRADLVQVG